MNRDLSFGRDFEAIERSFEAIAQIQQSWKRRLMLDFAADFHGCVKASFRRAFELWEVDRCHRQGGSNA